MRRIMAFTTTLAAMLLAIGIVSTAQKPADLTVTVSYTGKGPVDAKNDILVFLFDTPNVTAQTQPLMVQPVTKNGGAAVFKGVTADTVYVLTAYDEKANYDGTSGPPPAGTPIGSYAKDGKPVPVQPAKTPKIAVKFGDSRRWGQ